MFLNNKMQLFLSYSSLQSVYLHNIYFLYTPRLNSYLICCNFYCIYVVNFYSFYFIGHILKYTNQ